MLAPTPKLGLHQYEATDDFDYAEVVADNAAIDRLAVETVCTSATRPNTELFVGREIYETDTATFLKYDGAVWRTLSIEDVWVNFVPVLTGITLTAGYLAQYRKRGKTVEVEVYGSIASAPAGNLTIAPPLTPTRSYPAVMLHFGTGVLRDTSIGQYVHLSATVVLGVAGVVSSVGFYAPTSGANTNLAAVTNAAPIALVAGDLIAIKFSYQLA